MATIKEKFEKVMEYTDATAEQLLNMCEAELNLCYASVEAIEAESKSLARRGIHLKVEEDCGCGGCEANINEAILETLDLDTLVTAFDDLAGDETALVALIAHIVESVNDYEVQ